MTIQNYDLRERALDLAVRAHSSKALGEDVLVTAERMLTFLSPAASADPLGKFLHNVQTDIEITTSPDEIPDVMRTLVVVATIDGRSYTWAPRSE